MILCALRPVCSSVRKERACIHVCRHAIAPYAPPYPSGDLHVYDPVAMTWEDLSAAASGTPPAARCLHGFAALGGKLYVHGGVLCDLLWQERGAWFSDMHVYDTDARSWTDLSAPASGTKPYGRYGHGFAAMESKLYVHALSPKGYSESTAAKS